MQSLNLSGCNFTNHGTRAIIDGLNLNRGLKYLDLSFNDLSSSIYEFAIKVSKTICRHEQLMHLNLTETYLSREELFFIGMAMKHSKALVGLHLSLNELSNYDRVFLRILMNAKAAS